MRPRIRAAIDRLPASVPFVGPETQERQRGARFIARLGANENNFGPPPSAVDAMISAAPESWKYPDPENYPLKQALGSHLGVSTDNIVVGEGIDCLLGYLARIMVEDGVTVVTSDGAYPTFNYHVAGFGGTLVKIPYSNDKEDLSALLDAARAHDASIIYLSNPDNPMGTWHGRTAIQHLIDHLPGDCLLCLDEAYLEFCDHDIAPPIDTEHPGVIRMRTFSKAYGLAGLRVGYAVAAEPLISTFNKIRNHFGVNLIAQAGAVAALQDQAHLNQTRMRVAQARQHIIEIAQAAGLICLPSATNFVTIDCGQDGAFADAVLASLIETGIFVRKPFVAPQDRCIRISAGHQSEIAAFAAALPHALHAARGG